MTKYNNNKYNNNKHNNNKHNNNKCKNNKNPYVYDISLFCEKSDYSEEDEKEILRRLLYSLRKAFPCEFICQLTFTYYNYFDNSAEFLNKDVAASFSQAIEYHLRLVIGERIDFKKLRNILPGFALHTISRKYFCDEEVHHSFNRIACDSSSFDIGDPRIYYPTEDGKIAFFYEDEDDTQKGGIL